MKETILVVDDDAEIIELMKDFLEIENYNVLTAFNGEQALSIVNKQEVDCILLDVMMPGESGFSICKKLRDIKDVPILFLSAKEDPTDKIRGLSVGGDDYIVKTATPGEIVARIKAVRRRSGQQKPGHSFNGLTIDYLSREVHIHGRKVSLTSKEFDLLSLLSRHPHQVFKHDQIIQFIWGEHYSDPHTVRVFVARIREKIEETPSRPRWILTVWGVGYKFVEGA
ncbi:response regulator transcription factor [Bacillus haynesii]|uniref:response regulator transcription factor n=1 Tax=Bacillus haynesii TaxID=1925021 RepID=UPI0015948E7E|nr:response regulator transcription factor [Bacillus haynesii]NVB32834.1 response regulator transcription factor [Bacillus licheniformis]MCY7779992.1 response regulator transcription factor [Bacillus haynesii]MEC0669727.1 response regulator transcription factor [Bacillus haynesii]MEC1416615.1 response regulator transcription factor [Bacillus haynesii]MEC1466688.1 response regulator transcription factor [Bacillus haynesii]